MEQSEAGFTLVETLVALVIIGLAASVTLPAIADGLGRSVRAEGQYSLADQAQSVFALAKAGASLADHPEFSGWEVRRVELAGADQSVFNAGHWLEVTHTPTGQTYRLLVAE